MLRCKSYYDYIKNNFFYNQPATPASYIFEFVLATSIVGTIFKNIMS